MEFRIFSFVCKHWSVYYGFQCSVTFFWSKQTLFSNNSGNCSTEFRKFSFVCQPWSVYYGFQCLFTFVWWKQTLFWNNSKNWLMEFRKFSFIWKHWSVYYDYISLVENRICFEIILEIGYRNFENFTFFAKTGVFVTVSQFLELLGNKVCFDEKNVNKHWKP